MSSLQRVLLLCAGATESCTPFLTPPTTGEPQPVAIHVQVSREDDEGDRREYLEPLGYEVLFRCARTGAEDAIQQNGEASSGAFAAYVPRVCEPRASFDVFLYPDYRRCLLQAAPHAYLFEFIDRPMLLTVECESPTRTALRRAASVLRCHERDIAIVRTGERAFHAQGCDGSCELECFGDPYSAEYACEPSQG